jgi:hypothetical protein
MHILKNVDILDLVRIHVYKEKPTREDPLPYRVFIESIDSSKRIVFDEAALNILNQKVTERSQAFGDGRDPRIQDYIKEFVGRMVSELGKNGLAVIEDIPEGSEDPYATLRKNHPLN